MKYTSPHQDYRYDAKLTNAIARLMSDPDEASNQASNIASLTGLHTEQVQRTITVLRVLDRMGKLRT